MPLGYKTCSVVGEHKTLSFVMNEAAGRFVPHEHEKAAEF